MQVHFRFIPQTHLTLSGGKITSEVVSKIAGALFQPCPMHMGTVTGPLPCVYVCVHCLTCRHVLCHAPRDQAVEHGQRLQPTGGLASIHLRWNAVPDPSPHVPAFTCQVTHKVLRSSPHLRSLQLSISDDHVRPTRAFGCPWQVVDSELGNVVIQDLNCIREAIVASRAGTPPLLETLCDEGFEW